MRNPDSRLLASGPGWSVSDVICRAGPADKPFEEQHEAVCIAAVVEGTFRYRSSRGAGVLAPGAVLLGNHGSCFECGHEHGTGDRCIAFHFVPDCLESVAAAVPGVRDMAFSRPRLPPTPALIPLIAEAEAARDDGDVAELEELGLRLAGAVAAALADGDRSVRGPSRRDEQRVAEVLRRIEARSDEQLSLAVLARDAGLSPYHLLRTFRQVVGMTPHQYVLRTRLHRAALRIRRTEEPIAVIAFEVGFGDLSTFNHRFRRIMGLSPSAYRARFSGQADRLRSHSGQRP